MNDYRVLYQCQCFTSIQVYWDTNFGSGPGHSDFNKYTIYSNARMVWFQSCQIRGRECVHVAAEGVVHSVRICTTIKCVEMRQLHLFPSRLACPLHHIGNQKGIPGASICISEPEQKMPSSMQWRSVVKQDLCIRKVEVLSKNFFIVLMLSKSKEYRNPILQL